MRILKIGDHAYKLEEPYQVIAAGSFGQVIKVSRKISYPEEYTEQCVIKIFSDKNISKEEKSILEKIRGYYYGAKLLPSVGPSIVMPFLGFNLSIIFREEEYRDKFKDIRKKSNNPQRLNIARQCIARTLALHRGEIYKGEKQAIIHRDIKPENFVLDITTGLVFLVDYGFAVKADKNNQYEKQEYLGTKECLPPEIKNGKLNTYSFKTDCYSLGVTIAEILVNTNKKMHNIIKMMTAENPNKRLPLEFALIAFLAEEFKNNEQELEKQLLIHDCLTKKATQAKKILNLLSPKKYLFGIIVIQPKYNQNMRKKINQVIYETDEGSACSKAKISKDAKDISKEDYQSKADIFRRYVWYNTSIGKNNTKETSAAQKMWHYYRQKASGLAPEELNEEEIDNIQQDDLGKAIVRRMSFCKK